MLSLYRKALPSCLAVTLGLLLTACGEGGLSSSISGNTPEADSATLTWQAPLTRANGESLAMGEIKKYVVRYGPEQSIGERSYEATVEDGQAMEHTVAGLSKGTWHFALKAVDTNGLESEWSASVSKTIVR